MELDHAALKVTCQTRKEEIEKLQEQNRMLRSGLLPGATPGNDVITTTSGSSSAGCPLTTYCRLLYVKRSELIRRDALNDGQPNRYCRVMAYNETHGMLVVSQVQINHNDDKRLYSAYCSFLNGPFPASFSLFLSFQYTVDSTQMFNIKFFC